LKRKLYALNLLKKMLSDDDLKVLEAVWDEELDADEKIEILLRKK
jgi:hypothetical protein